MTRTLVNWTWPGRAHLIVRWPLAVYATLWLLRRRWHWTNFAEVA